MELFEQVRREYEFGVETIVGVAKKLGVHRLMVREANRQCAAVTAKEDGTTAVEAESSGGVRGCDP